MCGNVAVTKRIMITLPDTLLAEVDGFVRETRGNRSELIRDAMRFYLQSEKTRRLVDVLKRGYLEMGDINLAIAEESLLLENEAMEIMPGRKASGVN